MKMFSLKIYADNFDENNASKINWEARFLTRKASALPDVTVNQIKNLIALGHIYTHPNHIKNITKDSGSNLTKYLELFNKTIDGLKAQVEDDEIQYFIFGLISKGLNEETPQNPLTDKDHIKDWVMREVRRLNITPNPNTAEGKQFFREIKSNYKHLRASAITYEGIKNVLAEKKIEYPIKVQWMTIDNVLDFTMLLDLESQNNIIQDLRINYGVDIKSNSITPSSQAGHYTKKDLPAILKIRSLEGKFYTVKKNEKGEKEYSGPLIDGKHYEKQHGMLNFPNYIPLLIEEMILYLVNHPSVTSKKIKELNPNALNELLNPMNRNKEENKRVTAAFNALAKNLAIKLKFIRDNDVEEVINKKDYFHYTANGKVLTVSEAIESLNPVDIENLNKRMKEADFNFKQIKTYLNNLAKYLYTRNLDYRQDIDSMRKIIDNLSEVESSDLILALTADTVNVKKFLYFLTEFNKSQKNTSINELFKYLSEINNSLKPVISEDQMIGDAVLEIVEQEEKERKKKLANYLINERLDQIFEKAVPKQIKDRGKIRQIMTRVVVDPDDIKNKRYAIQFFTVGHNGIYGHYIQMLALDPAAPEDGKAIFRPRLLEVIKYDQNLDQIRSEEDRNAMIEKAMNEMSSKEYLNNHVVKDPHPKLNTAEYEDFRK